MSRLVSFPVTIKAAAAFVRAKHRHLPHIQGGLFAVGVAKVGASEPCGVAIVGQPSRMSQDGFTCVVTRCCTDGTPNACSKLYALCRRVAQTMGYRRCLTYTLEEESGASLFAAGCVPDGVTDGGAWGRTDRPRETVNSDPKVRWRL
jgi:hypothetical protein